MDDTIYDDVMEYNTHQVIYLLTMTVVKTMRAR